MNGINIMGEYIGVCWLTFDSLSLGQTVESVKITPVVNEKEIMTAQNGTKPYDFADTGIQWTVDVKIAFPTNAMLKKLLPGVKTGTGAWLHGHTSLFHSHRANYAKELIVVMHDSATGLPSTDPKFKFIVPLASPKVTGFKDFGPDTQTTLDVQFRSLYDPTKCCHIYSGAASSLGIT